MRVIFAGTPEFASTALARLHAAGHEMVLVLTQPDRPAGRGMKLQASAVKQLALTHHLPVSQPRSLRLDGKYPQDAQDAQADIAAADADVMVVAAYGLILPQWVLDAPRHGCLNIHASLLPRWRGAAPIHRAIEAGDAQTGVTIMQMDAGLDTGDMLLVKSMPIDAVDTTASLHDKLADLGGELMVSALAQIGQMQATPQPDAGVTYAHKIEKAEAAVNWQRSAVEIERSVRAFDPFPGVMCQVQGPSGDEAVKVWQAQVVPGAVGVPGTVLTADAQGVTVACGQDALRITQVQRPGGKRVQAAELVRALGLQPGHSWVSRN